MCPKELCNNSFNVCQSQNCKAFFYEFCLKIVASCDSMQKIWFEHLPKYAHYAQAMSM